MAVFILSTKLLSPASHSFPASSGFFQLLSVSFTFFHLLPGLAIHHSSQLQCHFEKLYKQATTHQPSDTKAKMSAAYDNEYQLIADVLASCEAFPEVGPYEIAICLSSMIPFLPDDREKLAAIGFAAIGQHIKGSRTAGIALRTSGIGKVGGAPDIPLEAVSKYQSALEQPEQYQHGWPVNFTFYAGRPYLLVKLMGVQLATPGSTEQLVPFTLRQDELNIIQQKKIRDVYLMFRNLLAAGVPTDYLRQVLKEGAWATVSVFETIQEEAYGVSMASVRLVAANEAVKKTLATGTFEELDNISRLKAEYFHARMSALAACGSFAGPSLSIARTPTRV